LELTWQRAAETELGEAFIDLASLSGGDFARAYRATGASGHSLFIKTHSDPPPGFFVTEANGLRWLRDSGAVNIPQVLAVGENPPYLALTWIEQGGATSRTESEFGRQLAGLHGIAQAQFGRIDNATTGSLALPNAPCPRWSEFFANRRLLPLLEIAANRHILPAADLLELERLAGRLNEFDVPDEPPSLLHGDLWAGNRMIDRDGASWMIDPAAHCGHREFDLGMMALFGGFDKSSFDAYHEAFPLVAGWQQRLRLHQLAPLLVHAIKFGGSYVGAVQAVLKAYG
jgi:fructosamine-3-kinase